MPPIPRTCFLCLTAIPYEGGAVVTLIDFPGFLQFCRAYLQVPCIDKLWRNHRGRTCPCCKKCGDQVREALEVWRELERLKMDLLWRVKGLGEVISKGKWKDEEDERKKLQRVGRRLNGTSLWKVKLLRRELARQCRLKERKMLPTIKLNKYLTSEDRQAKKSLKFLLGLIVIFTLKFNWNLDKFFQLATDQPAFITVGQGRSELRIPSRETLRAFCGLILLTWLHRDWNFSEILKHYDLREEERIIPSPPTSIIKMENDYEEEESRPGLQEIAMAVVIKKEHGEHQEMSKPSPLKRKLFKGRRRKKKVKRLGNPPKKVKERPSSSKRKVGRPVGWRKNKTKVPLKDSQNQKTDKPDSPPALDTPSSPPSPVDMDDGSGDDPSPDFEAPISPLESPPASPPNNSGHPPASPTKNSCPSENESSSSSLPPKRTLRRRKRRIKKTAEEIEESQKIKKKRTWKNIRDKYRLPLVSTDAKERSLGFVLKCPDCPESKFFRTFALEEHIREMHTENPEPLPCPLCDQSKKTYEELIEHMEATHEKVIDKPLFCYHCSESFTTPEMRSLHQRNIHWIYPPELYCEVENCSEKFLSTESLSDHLKSHGDYTTPVTCKYCQWSFIDERLLRFHEICHLSKNNSVHANKFPCTLCSFESRENVELVKHWHDTHVPAPQQPWLECPKDPSCKSTFYFSNNNYLQWHLSLHDRHEKVDLHESWNKSVACMWCQQEYLQKVLRREHELYSCPQRPPDEKRKQSGKVYICNKCDDFASDCRNHVLRHLLKHNPKPVFECPHCPVKFRRRDNRDIHIIRVHTKEFQYVCHLCARGCPTEWELKYHLKTHENAYMCTECGKTFTRGWTLGMHMRQHNGQRLQCLFCPQLFIMEETLRKHLIKEHPAEFYKDYDKHSRRRLMYKLVTVEKGDEDSGRKRRRRNGDKIPEQQQTKEKKAEEAAMPFLGSQDAELLSGSNFHQINTVLAEEPFLQMPNLGEPFPSNPSEMIFQ